MFDVVDGRLGMEVNYGFSHKNSWRCPAIHSKA
jgi:hypothetical protein